MAQAAALVQRGITEELEQAARAEVPRESQPSQAAATALAGPELEARA